ncbi:MAG: inorganic pyrophosphatase [Chloroflexi bacterium]|nr:MAG: inorganic pyrophosphatase [Chloroflexota bacterium]
MNYSRWRPHPWHGLDVGPEPPAIVTAFIEITPFDTVKYEVDKSTGYLRIDRPQVTSSTPPTLYGFIPRTYCARRVGALAANAEYGDGDPMDICVISERQVDRAEIILNAHVIGGLQMIDSGLADDKIIAVLHNDAVWGNLRDISELPGALLERLRHYFLTYKLAPGSTANIRINLAYGFEHAAKVIQAAIEDYQEAFGQIEADGKDLA